MATTENTFRTSLMGGFNRKDVMNYIGTSTRNHQEKVTKLETEHKKVNKLLAEVQDELALYKSSASTEQDDVVDMKEELFRLRVEVSQKASEAAAAKAQNDGLREQMASLAQGAAAYDDLKDRTASIELEAHQRAKIIEEEAKNKAKKARTEAEQILYKVQAGYSRLRHDIDATINHTESELLRVNKTLEGVKSEFDAHDSNLASLLREYNEVSDNKTDA